MKLKEKLANEFYTKSNCDDEEIVEAYIAGFEKNKKLICEYLLKETKIPLKTIRKIATLGE